MATELGPSGGRMRQLAVMLASGLLIASGLFIAAPQDTGQAREIAVPPDLGDQIAPSNGTAGDAPAAQQPPPRFDPLPADTQASDPPSRAVPSSRGGARTSTLALSTPQKFISVVADAAQESEQTTRVPASVTIAQAILESNWGKSLLATSANNLFGIKAQRGPGPAGIISMSTWEVLSGANTTVTAAFKAYHNIFESVDDHGYFLRNNPRYAAAFLAANDPREFARRITAAGYATDPAYASKLIGLMDKYNLYKYDLLIP